MHFVCFCSFLYTKICTLYKDTHKMDDSKDFYQRLKQSMIDTKIVFVCFCSTVSIWQLPRF